MPSNWQAENEMFRPHESEPTAPGNKIALLCNAHDLRELRAVFEIDGEPWACSMQRLLSHANRAWNLARQTGKPPRHSLLDWIQRRYDQTLDEAIAFHHAQPPLSRPKRGPKKLGVGHNLATRLQQHRANILRFLTDTENPVSNNEAERDIRTARLRQKISGGFRSQKGAKDFAILRTVITTARKQGWDIIETSGHRHTNCSKRCNLINKATPQYRP